MESEPPYLNRLIPLPLGKSKRKQDFLRKVGRGQTYFGGMFSVQHFDEIKLGGVHSGTTRPSQRSFKCVFIQSQGCVCPRQPAL